VSEGIIANNPARGIKKPAVGKRTRRLNAKEYRALGKVLESADDELWQGVVGTKLFLLTGFRLSEIAGLMWSEVDETGSCLRLDDSKEDASVRPVGDAVFKVLRGVPRDGDNPYVLPGPRSKKGHYTALDDALDRLTSRAGLTGVTSHTLRHSYASVAGDLGFTEITISALLGHAAGNVTQRYVHHLDAVLIAAANKVSDEITRLLSEEI
jgi:integrase